MLISWVRISPGAWIFVCCECRVLSGRGLCDELITRPEDSYRLWCVVVCDLETSRMYAPYIYDISRLRVKVTTGNPVISKEQSVPRYSNDISTAIRLCDAKLHTYIKIQNHTTTLNSLSLFLSLSPPYYSVTPYAHTKTSTTLSPRSSDHLTYSMSHFVQDTQCVRIFYNI